MNFTQLRNEGIREDVLIGVNKLGFIETTPVQEQAIPLILSGKDVLVQAPTGTGKTAAFGIPIINMSDVNAKCTETIILTPTRELTIQVAQELKKMASGVEGLRIAPIYGGQNLDRQLAYLRQKPQIIVATLGRVVSNINHNQLKLGGLKRVVLDEVDEMLDIGFREYIDEVFSKFKGKNIQTTMFSATIPPEIVGISKNYQHDAVCIKTTIAGQEIPDIKQYVLHIPEEKKYASLKEIIWQKGYKNILVFLNTKAGVENLNKRLNKDNINSLCLHSDMNQRDRDMAMKLYKAHDVNVLVATDVASRGIDVEGIEAIFNYDIPYIPEQYIHRIGRTARANKNGVAYSFCTPKDKKNLELCEKTLKNKLTEFIIDGVTNINKKDGQKFAVPTVRFFMNIGSKDGAEQKDIENMICAKVHMPKRDIYDYKIHDIYSFVEIDAKYKDEILALNGLKAFGRVLAIEVAGPKKVNAKKGNNKRNNKVVGKPKNNKKQVDKTKKVKTSKVSEQRFYHNEK